MTLLEAWERNARSEPITTSVLREHADRVARSIGATVLFSRTDYAKPTVRVVGGPAIVDHAGYAGRLHEFGHLETQDAKAAGTTIRTGMFSIANTAGEAAAWRWARTHALTWTSAMQTNLLESLATYRPFAKHGLSDPIWRELETVNGRLALGHAYHQLQTIGRLKLTDAQKLLAQMTR